jgi:hypothetical protein
MAGRWRTQDGSWSVEVVTLSDTPDHHDGQWIRIRRWGYYIADVRSPDDLAQYVALGELFEEALPAAGRRCLAPGRTPAPAFRPAGARSSPDRAGPDAEPANAATRCSRDAAGRYRRPRRRFINSLAKQH